MIEIARNRAEIAAKSTARLAVEIQRQGLVHDCTHRLAGFGCVGIEIVPVFGQPPRQQAQPADPEAQVVIAEKGDGRCARPAAHRGDMIEPVQCEPLVEPHCDGICTADRQFGRGMCDRRRQFLDDLRELDLAVREKRVTGLGRGCLLGLGAPVAKPAHGRRIKEQRTPEQFFDLRLDVGPQCVDDGLERGQLARGLRNRLKIVAHRLLTRDGGQRAKDHREKPRSAGIGMTLAANFVGMRIDIDEAPVDFALRRAVAQHRHRLGERGVDQHRAVDQCDRFGIAAVAMLGQHAFDKGGAAMPRIFAFRREIVDLGQL